MPGATSILWMLVFYISKADENRAAVRYRRLENSERKRRNFASRRDAERSAEVRYAPPGKIDIGLLILDTVWFFIFFAHSQRKQLIP